MFRSALLINREECLSNVINVFVNGRKSGLSNVIDFIFNIQTHFTPNNIFPADETVLAGTKVLTLANIHR